ILLKYSKALSIFKKALKSSQKHSISTLQTSYLQYFQDFFTLLSHNLNQFVPNFTALTHTIYNIH
ncbi:MAG: hypothetical protein KAQ75_09200, partial [Bacteroidales bacterium]|nr:hypothetical protein [Bacteroidales bacterium]